MLAPSLSQDWQIWSDAGVDVSCCWATKGRAEVLRSSGFKLNPMRTEQAPWHLDLMSIDVLDLHLINIRESQM